MIATAIKSKPARRRKKRKPLGMLWLLPAVLLLSSSFRDSNDSAWRGSGRITPVVHDPALSMDSGERSGDGSSYKGQHRVYPFSVVPGGAHGREQLAQAISRDSLVARHYSDFDVAKTKVVRLAAAKTAYVSYRVNDKIYWTRNRIMLARGEEVLTDGANYARTRCGNRISEDEPGETSDSEPSPEALDTPTDDLLASDLPDDPPVNSGPEFTPDLIHTLLGSNVPEIDDPGLSTLFDSVPSSLFSPEFHGGSIGFPGDHFVPTQNGNDGDLSVTPFIPAPSDLNDPGESSNAPALNVPETNSLLLLLMGLGSLAIHRYCVTKRKNTKYSKIHPFG